MRSPDRPAASDQALREIAEAADADGREWDWEHAYPQRITRVGDAEYAKAMVFPGSPQRGQAK